MRIFDKFQTQKSSKDEAQSTAAIEDFLMEVNKYVAAGVFKEIYSDKRLMIFNVLNQYYASFNLEFIKEYKNNAGIMMNSAGVSLSIENIKFYYEYVSGLSDEVIDKRVVELNDIFLEKLIKAKPKYDSIKPSKNIDTKLEERIKKQTLKNNFSLLRTTTQATIADK